MLASGVLAGCGFRLRGTGVPNVADRRALYVEVDDNVSIETGIRQQLTRRGYRLVRGREDADVLLRVADERIDERILSVQSEGLVSEIELSHSVDIVIAPVIGGREERMNEALRNRVEVVQEYTYDEYGVLGKEEEAQILRREMSEELVRQVVLRATASLASIAADPVDDS